MADAFHQAAVAGDHIGMVVNQVRPKAIGQQFFGNCHADGIGKSLAERAGCRFDAAGMAELRMSGGLGAELAEVLKFIQRHIRVPGKVQDRIEQHGSMTG